MKFEITVFWGYPYGYPSQIQGYFIGIYVQSDYFNGADHDSDSHFNFRQILGAIFEITVSMDTHISTQFQSKIFFWYLGAFRLIS